MMRIIVITDTPLFAEEATTICRLLDGGIDRIHLRKPEAEEVALRRLIEAIPAEYHSRLSLHDRLPLAVEYGIGGIHLNGRNPLPPAGFTGLVSRSCHTIGELTDHRTACDYLFLSPLFDSISKQGYRAAFTPDELRMAAARGAIGPHTVALGGVEPERLPLLRDYGFGGAALLGAVWRDTSAEGLHHTLEQIQKFR